MPMGRGNSRSSRLEVVANRMILPVKCKGRQSTLSSGSWLEPVSNQYALMALELLK